MEKFKPLPVEKKPESMDFASEFHAAEQSAIHESEREDGLGDALAAITEVVARIVKDQKISEKLEEMLHNNERSK